nr:SMY2 homolog 2 [Crassostrea gigas]
MSDIKALFLMKKQKTSHRKFQIPEYDTFQEEVLQTTKNTSDAIQQVNNYVALIKEEMHQLRMTVEVFNADLAKQMRTLISNLKANTDSEPDPPSQRGGTKNEKGQLSVPVNLLTGTTAPDKGTTQSNRIGDRPTINTNSNKKIDEKDQNSDNLKKIAALQKISNEQNELRKMMMMAANMANELENEGKISLEGLLELRKGVNKYAENLESADVEYARKKEEKRREEEKKKQEEEEKRKKEKEEEEARRAEEEERRKKAREEKRKKDDEARRKLELEVKKEEEERRQKELEEKRKREEGEIKKRKEEEENKRRRDWRNWAPMIYYRQDGTTAINGGIICIALAMEGEITQDDLTCYTSDGNKEREKCLEQDKREIPISSLVTVKPSTKSAIRLQEPIRIFIPHQANRGCRELIVRASIDGGTWKTMDYESDIPPRVDLEDIPMVQIAINNFKSVGIIVASRPKMHVFSLGRDGGTVETDSPNKTILTAPNGCFSEKTNGSIQITDKKHSTEMAKDVDDLRNAQVALTPHTITLDKKSKSNLTLEVYPELKRRVTRSQSALKACENIMIKKMDAEKVADILYGKGTLVNSSTIQEIKRKKLPEDKAMALLEKLKFCDKDQFQDLVDSLEESNQQHIANELKKALDDS